jgi:glycogen(starch) synthase
MGNSPDYLIEVSWEVCNKVGGIYTVVSSKAEKLVKKFGDNYLLVGPYFANNIAGVFEEQPINGSNVLCSKAVCDELKNQGIHLHFGRWLIEGEPKVVLIDFFNVKKDANSIKGYLWDNFKVDSLRASYDYDEPVSWAFAVGKFIEALTKSLNNKKLCCQFHEWLAGAGLLYLKSKNIAAATVFTTHATILGRTLVSSGFDLYGNLDKNIDPDGKARYFNIESKHTLEKASAANADAFTTVSEITGMEAEALLGRKPDVILPNGLDLDNYPTFEDVSVDHRVHRDQAREFLLYYFLPYYKFNIKETLFYFLASRYEFKNKGIDILIKSLGEVNKKLIADKSEKTVVTFFFVPANIRSIRPNLLENRTNFKDIKDDIDEVMEDIKKNVLYDIISGQELSKETLLSKDMIFNLKKKILRLSKKGNPSMSTHFLMDENDQILKAFAEAGLNNLETDKVKVIFYPIYLSGADGLLDLTYEQGIIASHLGIFPSYYEPWGYTPLECCANGVASVTTDLAGFGRYVKPKLKKKYQGTYVIDRFGKNDDDAIKQMTDVMYNFAKLSKKDRVENKISAREIAELADWSNLIENYFKAFELAISKKWS